MAQKPNFLKKLISAGLVTASTATIIAGFAGSAMGAAQKTANAASAAFGTAANWQPAVAVGDGDAVFFAPGFDATVVGAANKVTFNNNGVANTKVQMGAGQLNVAGAVGAPNQLTLQATNAGTIFNLGPNGLANFFAQAAVGDYSGLLAIDFNGQAGAQVIIATNGFNSNVNFLDSTNGGAAIGDITVNATGVVLGGAFGANIVRNLEVTKTSDVTINSNLTVGRVTLQGLANTPGGALSIGAGKTVTDVNIGSQAAGTGTLTFLGADGQTTIVTKTDIGGANDALNQINVAGAVEFKGGVVKATKINLTAASSLMRFTTTDNQEVEVIADILPATNGQGGIAVNGVNLVIAGNIGANDNSLATINFETDHSIQITLGANASAFFVQNVNTFAANNGILELKAGGDNFAINGNVGGNNALKIVNLVGDAANYTLKQGGTINAQNIGLSNDFDNTLTLEEGTKVTGDIINRLAAGNGTIALTGNATVNGDIGVAGVVGGGNALKNITLGGNNLAYGGKNIQLTGANGITFAANETLALTNATDPITINSNIIVTTDKQGIMDASAVTNNQTLTISGKIGIVDTVNNPAQNVSLGQLNVGSSKTVLNSGDAAINELIIGNNGSVHIAHDNYLITKTTNTPGQGTIIINPVTAVNANNTNLVAGTNLGSAAAPLGEINFGAAVDSILNFGQGVNLYATNITTATANAGSFNFNAGGTNIVSGTVGGQQGNKLNNVTLSNGTTAAFLGNATFNGATTIGGNSTLQIGGNYTAPSIAGANGNDGIVQFVNADNITVTLQKQANAVNALTQMTVSGFGNVVFNETGNAVNHGINATTIAFTGASLGASVLLPSGIPLNDAGNTVPLTITSTVGNKGATGFDVPGVIVSGVDSTIANDQVIGDQNNIVGLGLASDNGIIVNPTTLYAGIYTVNDNQGTVTLSGGVPNTPGTIYGLGLKLEDNTAPKLKQVTFTTDYNNLGSIFATNATINDGVTVTTGGGVAGKDFDGKITLGSANGNSNVRFVDGINSTPTSAIVTTTANNGTVTYLGDANVGNIGASDTPVASVQFTGPAGSLEFLQGNIYSGTTNFGSSDLVVAASNVILGGGTTAINGEIHLATNTLTFASGTSTWGAATSLSTTLNIAADGSGVIGHIVIAEGAQVNATTTGTTTIEIEDNLNANFSGTKEYILIQGGARFNGTLGGPDFVTGSNRFVNYGLIRAANQDYVITRTNDAARVVTNDIGSSQFAGVPNVAQNVTTFVNATNTAAYNNLLLAKNSADSANFVGAIVTDTSAATTNANLEVAKDIQAQLGNRLGALRYLGTPETAEMAGAEGGLTPQALVAAGDEAVDNVAYGIWAKPFYNVANQDKKGGIAGYKAKTTGIVIGLDTLANDNLMVGAAIGITKTDIKHQDYKKGDKTDVNGFSFSLYGAQQLVENFFAQGSAIFSLNQVKNKSQRYFFDATNGKMSKQIAAGNYDNMTFGGNLTVGYDYNAMEGVLLTPMAGLNYLKSSDENYKETGTTVANKQVNSKFSDRTDLIVGAKVSGATMNITDLAVYPEAHAFVVHKVNGRLSKTQSVLDGQATPFISQPDRTAKTSYNVGLSASIRPDAKMEYGIGYDFNAASKYTAHQGTLKVRVNF